MDKGWHAMTTKHKYQMITAVVAVYTLLTACSTWRHVLIPEKFAPAPNRGILVNHELHVNEGLDCTDCHEVIAGERVSFFDHETCMLCHEIPENSIAEPVKFKQDNSCRMCHTRADYSVLPDRQLITDEMKFDHEIHLLAEVDCTTCHQLPDKPMPNTGVLMAQCMECHQQTEYEYSGVAQTNLTADVFKANDCSVCHKELSKETIPTHRHGRRIAHDKTGVWKKAHGVEAALDMSYCSQCHTDEQDDCMKCHRVSKPTNHTAAWNRKQHGLHAQMNSQSCSVCHEEDSCVKCHKNTAPRSHRASFSAPRNNHCASCHVPAESSCTICHESIEHRSAIRTPHDAGGGYTGNCAQCHPGGISGAAPHQINTTIGCLACHE